MERIPTKYAAFAAFVLVMLATFTESKFTTLNVVEGDVALLNFSYSCNSTEVTLRQGNGAPFYNSRIPNPPSSSNLKLRNGTDGKVCFLYLTIDPVTRDDAGAYILTAYNNGPMLFEDERILLLVSYPPGKASCSLGEEYIDQDWVRLQCTASVGTMGGYIMCYQNGSKIPPLNFPQQHDETLSQILLTKVGDLVYCCSRALDQTKDRCDCKDSVWDPIQNKQVTKYVSDPCPPTVTTVKNPPISLQPIEDNGYELTSPSIKTITGTTPQIHARKVIAGLIVFICLLILVIVILVALLYGKKRQRKPANCKKENGHVLESFIS